MPYIVLHNILYINQIEKIMDKTSYAFGLNVGQQLKDMGLNQDFGVNDFAAGVADVLMGHEPQVEPKEAEQLLKELFTQLDERQRQRAVGEGERFLQDNAQRDGVQVTPSGLQYQVLREGTGRQPTVNQSVRCHYEGRLLDGTVFDSSYHRGRPADFGLSQVIAGWTEGLQLMREGAKYRFFIPYHLAYGERGVGSDIPPYATLIFDVELLQVL